MTRKIRSIRVSPALVVSCLALFMALTGSALAVGIAKNSVRSAQIVDGTIRTVDLHDGAVTAAKVAEKSLTANDLAANSVTAEAIAPNAVEAEKIAPNAVTSAKIAPNAVGANQIAPHSVGSGQLGTVTQRSNSATIAKNSIGSVSVSCAPGEQVLSGGGQPSVFGVEMTTTRPSGNGWLYQAKNNTASDQTITAFALCLAN
jgi:hypothetical protein